MDFSEPPEHAMLREAVGGIAAKFGHEYFAERARTGGKADRALGRGRRRSASSACTSPRSTAAGEAGSASWRS